MLRRSSYFSMVFTVMSVALLPAGALAQSDIGLLPFRAKVPEAYYAHVLVETLGDITTEGAASEPSHRRFYYKEPDSPEISPFYFLDTTDPSWRVRDLEAPPVVYAVPPLPARPLDLFYTNYEIRIYGLDEVAGRSCFLTSILSRTTGLPAIDNCVDRETGLALRSTTYDAKGNATDRTTYLEFDTAPDLSGIEFRAPSWTSITYPSTDLTADQLSVLLPWLRLPTWLPGNFELLAIQHWHSQTPDGHRLSWYGSERVQIVFTDGLHDISITAFAPSDGTRLPKRSEFSQPKEPQSPNMQPTLSAPGPYRLVVVDTGRIPRDDLYRILWSMLPPDPGR